MRFFLGIILFLFLSCNLKSSPKVVSGILDLRSSTMDEMYILEGDWEFYWEKFLYPSDFTQFEGGNETEKRKSNLSMYTKIPADWKGINWFGKKLPGHGYATYRMKILLSEVPSEMLALHIKDQAHAYNMYINGKLVVSSGKAGKNFETTEPDLRLVVYEFTPDKPEIELIFHVSNFHHRLGGLRYAIRFGTERKVNLEREKKFIFDAFLFGGFFIIALYHFAIFIFRRKNKAPLYFAIFCISLLAFSMMIGERFLHYYFPSIFNWDFAYRIEFFFLCLTILSFIFFFKTLYPIEKKILNYPFQFLLIPIPVGFILLTFFTKPVLFTELLIFLDATIVIGGLLIITQLIISIKKKKEGSIFFAIGFLTLFTCAVLDMFSARSIISLPRLIKFGLTSMLFLQAILLAKIFTGDFLKSEILSVSLSETNRAYSRFIPTEFLNLLDKKSILDINLGDHTQKEMTILFSDIRSFTSLSEKMTPTENFKFLNTYLNRIAPIIKKNNGFIDKYIGDAIMGLFPNTADDALLASIEMQREIFKYNQVRKKLGSIPIKVGIGLHTGSLILGTIGHDERMEGTVISDAVNLASRLEGLTKHYGSNILISENTFTSLENPKQFNFRLLDNVLVKGKEDSIFVIEILDGLPEDLLEKFMNTKNDFETGNLLYKQKAFEASINFFKKVLEINPLDTATAFYLKRAEYYNIHGAPPDWEGGEVFLDK